NGIGTGLADIITRRLYDGIDWEITNTNSIVSGFTLRSMVPVVADNDREALRTALFLLRRHPQPRLRVARIRDTLHLEHLQTSPALLEGAAPEGRIEVQGPPVPLRFDAEGNLL